MRYTIFGNRKEAPPGLFLCELFWFSQAKEKSNRSADQQNTTGQKVPKAKVCDQGLSDLHRRRAVRSANDGNRWGLGLGLWLRLHYGRKKKRPQQAQNAQYQQHNAELFHFLPSNQSLDRLPQALFFIRFYLIRQSDPRWCCRHSPAGACRPISESCCTRSAPATATQSTPCWPPLPPPP